MRFTRPVAALWAVLLGLALGGAGLWVAQRGSAAWIGWAALGVLAAIGLARRLEWALTVYCGIAWIALGTPGLAVGGSGAAKGLYLSEIGLVGLLAAWALRRGLTGQAPRPVAGPLGVPMLVFLGVSVWSAVHSWLFPDLRVLASGQRAFVLVNLVELGMRALALGAFLLSASVLTGRWPERALAALCAAALTAWILGFTPLRGMAVSFMAFPQTILMAVCAALLLGGDGTRLQRAGMLAILAGLFWWICIRNAQWVSGLTAVSVALGIVAFVAHRRVFWAGIALAALGIALNGSYFYDRLYVQNFYAGGAMGSHTRSGVFENDRTRMLRASLRYAETFPLGVGPGNYRPYNAVYGRPDVWNTTTFTSAHGTWAQALSETGWPGLIALWWLLGRLLASLWRPVRATPPGRSRHLLLALFAGCTGIVAASFLGDYLFPAYHNGGLATFGACVSVWLAAGISRAIARREAEAAP